MLPCVAALLDRPDTPGGALPPNGAAAPGQRQPRHELISRATRAPAAGRPILRAIAPLDILRLVLPVRHARTPLTTGRAGTARSENDHAHYQWRAAQHRRHRRRAAALGAARSAGADRHQIRLRHRPVRRLHGASGWQGGALLHAADRIDRRPADHHHRSRRQDAHRGQRAKGMARSRGGAMRLLPVRADHVGGGAAGVDAQPR